MHNVYEQNSTVNADAHLLRLFLAWECPMSMQADEHSAEPWYEYKILSSSDISAAFLNAEIEDSGDNMVETAADLCRHGLGQVKPRSVDLPESHVWTSQCTKALGGVS